MFCDRFTNCVFKYIFYGLRYDSGISTLLKNEFDTKEGETQPYSKYLQRLFLDVGYHMILKGVFLTMLLAVFIVSYMDLKKSHDLLIYDTNNKCFICHLDRDTFHKYKINFKKHVNNEHKLLNYFYFIMYILTKNPLNLSKVEKYVLDKFRISNYYWIPSKDTLMLQEKIQKIQQNKIKISSDYTIGINKTL